MLITKFEEQVEKTPGQIAVKEGKKSITYKELHQYASRIAGLIRGQCPNNDENQTVGLLFDSGSQMIAGILGTLKAGKIYVPLASNYPEKRLIYMLSNAECSLILTHSSLGNIAMILSNAIDIPYLEIDQADITLRSNSVPDSLPEATGDNPAYIMYTSGSTGWPKGVMQTHENVLYYIKNWSQRFSIDKSDRMTLFSSFCHDGSVQDMFGALLNGATLYPLDMRNQGGNVELSLFLNEEKISIWHSVPSLYNHFVSTLTGTEEFPHLRFILLGGEALRAHEVRMFKEYFPYSTLVNVYGQTESSVNSTWAIRSEDLFDVVLIGTPLDNTEILLIGEDGSEASPLQAGEIIISCPHISPGYWRDEESTRKVFRNQSNSNRLYRTGDMGRLQLDGSIEFMGRKDSQIKIRGFRIELGEIESQLLTHEQVHRAVVTVVDTNGKIARTDQNNQSDTHLCTYFVPLDKENTELKEDIVPGPDSPETEGENRGKPNKLFDELRDYLSKRLPEYMVPTFFMSLDQLPLTGSGKVDRRALPLPELNIRVHYTAPRNEIERKLVNIWLDVLGIDEVIGIDDNFFQLGGHSLKATVLVSWIYDVFHVKCPLSEIFKTPTIRGLAVTISTLPRSIRYAIEPVERQEYYPLSSAQKRLYFLQHVSPESTTYNMPLFLPLDNEMEKDKLDWILKKLIARHESLRTSFILVDDEPMQHIYDKVEFIIEQYDLTVNPEIPYKGLLKSFIRPFDLSHAPLIRSGIITMSDSRYTWMVDIHHIVTDGTSSTILTEDFMALYNGKELEPLKLQYKEFLNGRTVWLTGEKSIPNVVIG